ncbi:MAG TPA: heme ABC exporter ATP-binding protein CcmA [Nitrospiria bacterium]|nr:heme ABC exporter ATP-binding protein CcmA [Nitrospiria bacterium]
MSSLAIHAESISKSYHHYQVLQELSFELEVGTCYALFGPNGAGKTTLLKILATVHRPSGGRLAIMGRNALTEREAVRRQFFLLAHGSHLYDELNAVENLRFALGLRGVRPSDREIKLALDRVGIGAFADMKIRYFSAGMKKRLAIAKALLVRPPLLLMDEAYSSLDEKGIGLVNQMIRDATRSGTAVFMTTHDRTRVAEVAHRAGILRQGALQELTLAALTASDALF